MTVMLKYMATVYLFFAFILHLVLGNGDVYIVMMEGEPAVTYRGDIEGFSATSVDLSEEIDITRTVISLPPIINGAHSSIRAPTATSSGTKNVFIECTATDLTKAKTVLNTMVTMFSENCEKKYEVEPVMVIYPDGRIYELESCDKPQPFSCVYPDLSATKFEAPLSAIIGASGISLSASEPK